jgi:hypothetical protein
LSNIRSAGTIFGSFNKKAGIIQEFNFHSVAKSGSVLFPFVNDMEERKRYIDRKELITFQKQIDSYEWWILMILPRLANLQILPFILFISLRDIY